MHVSNAGSFIPIGELNVNIMSQSGMDGRIVTKMELNVIISCFDFWYNTRSRMREMPFEEIKMYNP